MATKICSGKNGCNKEKDISEFVFGKNWCKACQANYNRKYREIHSEEIKELKKEYQETHKEERKQYLLENKDQIREVRLEYDKNHAEELSQAHKLWVEENKEDRASYLKDYCRDYQKDRRENDPIFNLRTTMSIVIGAALKKNDGSKYGESILSFLPYTIKELKDHIEAQFQPWMTWDNRGVYDPEIWNDENPLTWTWQLDHIVPQSKLLYTSMEDENFQKCWALSNLRPLSAKQNLLDGNRRAL